MALLPPETVGTLLDLHSGEPFCKTISRAPLVRCYTTTLPSLHKVFAHAKAQGPSLSGLQGRTSTTGGGKGLTMNAQHTCLDSQGRLEDMIQIEDFAKRIAQPQHVATEGGWRRLSYSGCCSKTQTVF